MKPEGAIGNAGLGNIIMVNRSLRVAVLPEYAVIWLPVKVAVVIVHRPETMP
tara:strand:+ start:93 stop:248 length:156 start_codon:yes stop_codon:yes gene_type:complete